ncbi:hypothetical protein [Anaerocaecibacter muris]|uniref:hypothetical protein n=1 Tax=Anaerocaecibacter muris TaxID=2941513 RepID=UPI00204259B9|nr:hypothetical protein [Anaerocaecibacter muris]
MKMHRKQKHITALIKNDRGEICHRIKDIVRMALGRNEMVDDTKKYIVENYKEYTVEFVLE